MKTVMVVEDDLILADTLEDMLVDGGYTVCGVASNVPDAIELGMQKRPDLGVIDLRLEGGGLGTDVARVLRRVYRFGVLYATGNHEFLQHCQPEGEGYLAKPFGSGALLAALSIITARLDGTPIPVLLPRGFNLLV